MMAIWPQPADEVFRHRLRRAQPREHRHEHRCEESASHIRCGRVTMTATTARDPRIATAQRRRRAWGWMQREQHQQPDQHQAHIGRQQQQPDLDRQRPASSRAGPRRPRASSAAGSAPRAASSASPGRIPGSATVNAAMPAISSTASAACWAPTIGAAEREHRPIGHDDADLRQQIDAEHLSARDGRRFRRARTPAAARDRSRAAIRGRPPAPSARSPGGAE